MVGSCLEKFFEVNDYKNIIRRTHGELDLINQRQTLQFFKDESLEYVFLLAAKVGGINANNKYRGQFIYENLMIQNNVIHSAHKSGVKKLIFIGSACIYPKFSKQPISEKELLNGYLEKTNEPYAVAKIAGIKLCQSYYEQYKDNFISLMPNNLYGPNDNFDLETSHVIPALIRKFHQAKLSSKDQVTVWGTGNPQREFVHVDDLIGAMIFTMENIDAKQIYNKGISHINVSSGEEVSIKELAFLLKNIVGFKGNVIFDESMPDGTPRKVLDGTFLNQVNWTSKIRLENGLRSLYSWYIENQSK
tara:strand:+ start:423 stop:1334 length:912 start_codon:yes stop_codon:yes gene_type:complete